MVDGNLIGDLRLLRIIRGLSQDELAKRAGLDPSTISRLERGYRRPTPRVLKAVLGVLKPEDPPASQGQR